MHIRVLPEQLANQIAAGEVIERPASVVKEILENSIDAKATKIVIDIEQGGIQSICVCDNGQGIEPEDLSLAFMPHATSKIQTFDDLTHVTSLGFRGEALASISSIARVHLISKTAKQKDAWQIKTVDHGKITPVEVAAHPNGTTILIQDLFYSTPVRRKFLKSAKTEFTHIDECIRRIALSYMQIEFILRHQGKCIRHYRSVSDKQTRMQRLAKLCSEDFVRHSIHVESEHHQMKLEGFIAGPGIGDKQLTTQYFYVNGRAVRDRFLNHALRQAFELAQATWQPAYILFLSLSPELVDVNVHPTKYEVRFLYPRRVHDFLVAVLMRILVQTASSLPITPVCNNDERARPIASDATGYHAYSKNLVSKPLRLAQPSHQYAHATSVMGSSKVPMRKDEQLAWLSLMTPESEPTSEPSSAVTSSTIDGLCVIHQRYLLCRTQTQFQLIDLPVFDYFNQLQALKISREKAQQELSALLMPVRFSVEPDRLEALKHTQAFLQMLGVCFKIVDKKFIVITHAPSILQQLDLNRLLNIWLAQIQSEHDDDMKTLLLAKHMASLKQVDYQLEPALKILQVSVPQVLEKFSKTCTINALLSVFENEQ